MALSKPALLHSLAVGVRCLALGYFLARRYSLHHAPPQFSLPATPDRHHVKDLADQFDDFKMVLVVRNDLKMGKSKVAAQCSHATIGLYKKVFYRAPKALQRWEMYSQMKVVTRFESEEEMSYLQTRAKTMKLPCHIAVDAGRTQIAPSTYFAPAAANAAGNAAAADAADSRPRLLAPVRHLLSDAVQRGYAKFNSQGLARATSNPKFVAAPDTTIVGHYSAIIRSIVNYYSFVHGRSALWKVTSVYRKSCALTLARKHSLRSAHAAFCKFGPKLRIATPDAKDPAVLLFYPESLKTTGKFNVHAPRYSQVAILQEPFEKKRWR